MKSPVPSFVKISAIRAMSLNWDGKGEENWCYIHLYTN